MNHKTRHEAYLAFVDFIRRESQSERQAVNQRMLSVLLWCFIFPAVLSATVLILVRFGVIPFKARFYTEWFFLIFPIAYSLYFLSAEVLRDLPNLYRQGGAATILRQCQTEGAWREKMVDAMNRSVHASREEWIWILKSFKIDLEAMRYRTRFLTGLAGAVFFIITQGLDMLGGEDEQKVTWIKDQAMGWVELVPSDSAQYAALVLFLVLLYLSGNQNINALSRYLNCAELAQADTDPSNKLR